MFKFLQFYMVGNTVANLDRNHAISKDLLWRHARSPKRPGDSIEPLVFHGAGAVTCVCMVGMLGFRLAAQADATGGVSFRRLNRSTGPKMG